MTTKPNSLARESDGQTIGTTTIAVGVSIRLGALRADQYDLLHEFQDMHEDVAVVGVSKK